jgi:hypothetical protein
MEVGSIREFKKTTQARKGYWITGMIQGLNQIRRIPNRLLFTRQVLEHFL